MPSAKASTAPQLAAQLGAALEKERQLQEKLARARDDLHEARAREEEYVSIINELRYTKDALQRELDASQVSSVDHRPSTCCFAASPPRSCCVTCMLPAGRRQVIKGAQQQIAALPAA